MSSERKKRIIGIDAHPDSFTAAIVSGTDPDNAQVEKIAGPLPWCQLEDWFSKYCGDADAVALEASANSFAAWDRLHAMGLNALVLDSSAVSRLGKVLCETDKTSAVRIAKVMFYGSSEQVWVPDPVTRDRRKLYSFHQQAKADSTRNINRIKSMLNEHMIRLPKGHNLRTSSTQSWVLAKRQWSEVQRTILAESFQDLPGQTPRGSRLAARWPDRCLMTPACSAWSGSSVCAKSPSTPW